MLCGCCEAVAWLAVMLGRVVLTVVLGVIGACIFGGKKENLSSEFAWQFRAAAKCRTPILVLVVVPMSCFLRFCGRVGIWMRRRHRDGLSPEEIEAEHKERVAVVVEAVKAGRAAGKVLRTARKSWSKMSVKLADDKVTAGQVPTGHLNNILGIDKEAMTVTMEPFVSMGQVKDELRRHGLGLKCLIEMDSITIGGVALGFGIETNSHRVGFFQETVTEYELVSGDGKVRSVTPESDKELFYAIPWSMGCLGFCTAITCQVVKYQPYVHVSYLPTASPRVMVKLMEDLAYLDDTDPTKPDFIEATAYSKDTAMVQVARFCDAPSDPKIPVSRINLWFKPFYFRAVEKLLKKHIDSPAESVEQTCFEEYIPTDHYYDRFSRSIFWELEDMIPFANHPLYRFFWGWMGAPEVSLLKLAQGPVIRKASLYAHAVQESIVPLAEVAEGVEKFDDWFGVYPLLVFPARVYDRGQFSGMVSPRGHSLPGKDYGIFADIGVYGVPQDVKDGKVWDAKGNCRKLEHWTRDKGGFEATYTDLFCTRIEYRTMFDHTLFDKVYKRLGCKGVFPEPYDKVRTEPGLMDLSAEEAAEQADQPQPPSRSSSSNDLTQSWVEVSKD